MNITLDPSITKRMNETMEIDDVALPFYAPLWWVKNGDASLKALKNATFLYYGGWLTKETDLNQAVEYGQPIPGSVSLTEITPKTGDSFNAYGCRNLWVAPCRMRTCWKKEEGKSIKRSPTYVQGYRQQVHALVYMGIKDEDQNLLPWGPVILSAQGYQSGYLKTAFKDWEVFTAKLRKAIAPNIPAWCFYAVVGTFGQERKFEMKGSGSQQSPVTPISVYRPTTFTEKDLATLFVGEDVARKMYDIIGDSEAWGNAWGQQMDEKLPDEEIPNASEPEFDESYEPPF